MVRVLFKHLEFLKEFLIEFFIISVVLTLLGVWFYTFIQKEEIDIKEGVYKNNTNFPSFRGNYIALEMVYEKEKKIKVFLGKSFSEIIFKKSTFSFKIVIYLNSFNNFDLLFYNWKLFKKLLQSDSELTIEITNEHAWLVYNLNHYNLDYYLCFRNIRLLNTAYLVLEASFYPTNKGLISLDKNLYIKEIDLKINLLRVK